MKTCSVLLTAIATSLISVTDPASAQNTPPPLLFNVETDPAEKFDYAADHPEIVAELLKLIERQKAAVKPGTVQE